MINVTDKLVIKTTQKAILSEAIRNSLLFVFQFLEEEYGKYTGQGPRGNQYFGFQRFFPVAKIMEHEYDEGYLHYMFSLASCTTQERSSSHIEPIRLETDGKVPTTYYGNISSAISVALVHIWSNDHILLPTSFNPGVKTVSSNIMRDLHTEVLEYFDTLLSETYTRPADYPDITDAQSYAIEHLMKRVLYSTDWHTFDRINLVELTSFRDANVKAKRGTYKYKFKNAGYPIVFFLEELHRTMPDNLQITHDDIEEYIDVLKTKKTQDNAASKDSETLDLIAASKNVTHDEILEYLSYGVRDRKFDNVNDWYVGRYAEEGVPQRKQWLNLVSRFIEYWSESYEATENKVKSFYKWFDYMFVYIPWWFEINPDNKLVKYNNPKDIVRAIHIKRVDDLDINEYPLTYSEFLCEMLPSDKSRSTIAASILSLQQFYKWYMEEFDGESSYIPDNFIMPVKQTDVSNRGTGRVRSNKIKIPKKLYPLMIGYAKSVEYALKAYQDRVLEGEIILFRSATSFDYKLNPNDTEKLKEFVCPIFYHNDVMYKVETTPYLSKNYSSPILKNGKKMKMLPTIATFRAITFMMLTGLRMAAISWLDKTNFNSMSSEDIINYRLYVNTDKAREKGFTTLVTEDAWKLLEDEIEFMDKLGYSQLNVSHPYKGREHSRFGNIYPIFCSHTKVGQSITTSSVSDVWSKFLDGFETWYNNEFNDDIELVIKYRDKDNRARLRAINTVHALRKTVISERSTIMPVSVNAKLVGHLNASTNIYYQELEEHEIDQMLSLSNDALNGCNRISFDKNNPSYIKPSNTDSALRKAFGKSRVKAADKFGFTSVSLVQTEYDSETKEDKLTTGLSLLHEASASNIVYFDECICPVGAECPSYVLSEIYEKRRCGLCRLGIKTVDNIPAINSRKIHLEKSARLNKEHAKRLREDDASEDVIGEYYDKSRLDSLESIAWHLAENTLYAKVEARKDNKNVIHVDDPDMVKRCIERYVSEDSPESVRLLKEIADANAYVDLQTEEVRSKSSRLLRMMFNVDEGSIFDMDYENPVASLCSRITNEISMKNLTIKDVVGALEVHRKEIVDKQKTITTADSHKLVKQVLVSE